MTGKKAHRTLTAIQDGQLTEDGLEYKNNRAVWKKIADTPAPFGFVNIFISKIDPETKLVVSVEAKQITDEEALKLVNGEMTLQEAGKRRSRGNETYSRRRSNRKSPCSERTLTIS